jgi:hypothetical protein
MALPGAPRASALAAGGEAAALRQLGFDARLAVPAHQLSRFPQLEVDDALRFTDREQLEGLVHDTDVVIAAHPAALPLLQGLPARSDQVVACVLRELGEDDLEGRMGDLCLLAPSAWMCRHAAERFGWRVEQYPLSADTRYFHPIPDEPSSGARLHLAMHFGAVATAESVALRDLLADSLPSGTTLASFGPSLDVLAQQGAPEGAWREHHVESVEPTSLARLLGRTDIMIEMAAAPTGEAAAAAMACAAIPVVPQDSAAAELIAHGTNGLVMRSGDRERWRDAVVQLTQDWPRLRRLQTAAVQSATCRAELETAMRLYLLFERAQHALRREGPSPAQPVLS